MNRPNKDLITPTRTRSAIPVSGEGDTGKPSVPYVSTRGSFTLRPASAPKSAPDARRARSLHTFMEEVRTEVKGFPLTILLHGWGSDLTTEFLRVMFRSLRKEDALWLIPFNHEDQAATPPIKGAVILQPDANDQPHIDSRNIDSRNIDSRSIDSRNIDSRIYGNLITELAYFPAIDNVEAAYLSRLQYRARTVIVDEQGAQGDTLLRMARETNSRSYLWSKGSVLAEEGKYTDGSAYAADPDTEQLDPDLEQVGRMLGEMAKYLRGEYDRRFAFRSDIEKITTRFAGQPRWNERLVRLADAYRWPSWAVESLPSLYVVRGTTEDGLTNAYVWHRIRASLPKTQPYEVLRELCQGQFFELRMPPETAETAQSIAQTIEEHLRANSYASDDGFEGTVAHALREIEALQVGVEVPDPGDASGAQGDEGEGA